jgi:phosphatidylserine/phosphatidylglycerophosphate/cardiolipin synthase-like enzyme
VFKKQTAVTCRIRGLRVNDAMRIHSGVGLVSFCTTLFTQSVMASSAVDQVVPLYDPATEYALKIQLIQGARTSVDIIMYDQGGDDEAGRPLLQALREAAQRKVKVRMVKSFFAALHSDLKGKAQLMLNDDSLPVRPELVTYGQWLKTPLPGRHARIWNTFDEKLLIVDGRVAVLGGRGQGASYLKWRDLDLYLEGPVVGELQKVFERCWPIAVSDYGNSRKDRANARGRRERERVLPVPPALAARFSEAAALPGEVGRADGPVKVLHHDFIQKMHAKADIESDPILERFVELTRRSSRILVYSLYTEQDTRVRDALIAAARRGARVAIMTNSLESARALGSNPWPYLSGVESQLALARAGVEIHQWKATPELEFLHAKAAVFDDSILFGSHNFNWSSTHSYDELDIEVPGRAFADELAGRFELDIAINTFRVSSDFLSDQTRQHRFGVWSSAWFRGFY